MVEVEVEISELSQLVKQIIVDLLGCKTLKHGVSIERNIQKAKDRERERERGLNNRKL